MLVQAAGGKSREEETRAGRLPEYGRVFSGQAGTFRYLHQAVIGFLPQRASKLRILDIGCGNGHWAGCLLALGHDVVGVDASAERIAQARGDHPAARFEQLEVDELLLERLGEAPFDVVVSTEVVEHLPIPSRWAAICFEALGVGGRLVCSAPYHGYLKNVLISLGNRWDRHHHSLRDLGHVKFFSVGTLTELLERAGFRDVHFRGAGGYPYLWKSMVLTADRPTTDRPPAEA